MPEPNGWNEWGKHVLAELERLNSQCKELLSLILDIKTEVIVLKTKAGFIGAIAGAVCGAGIAFLFKLLSK